MEVLMLLVSFHVLTVMLFQGFASATFLIVFLERKVLCIMEFCFHYIQWTTNCPVYL